MKIGLTENALMPLIFSQLTELDENHDENAARANSQTSVYDAKFQFKFVRKTIRGLRIAKECEFPMSG